MEILGQIFAYAMDIAKMDFDVFGHSISLFDLWAGGAVITLVLWAIGRLLLDD